MIKRPRLVLRIAFAGNRQLPDPPTQASDALRTIFECIAQRLAEIAPNGSTRQPGEPRVSDFYSDKPPLLRLVTGLCSGGDALAARALFERDDDDPVAQSCERELAAVIPFDFQAYRNSQDRDYLEEFDKQAHRCSYILALDGIYDKPTDPEKDKGLPSARRAAAYRGQGQMLLRHADLLVALADPQALGKAGGTMETVRSALEIGKSVVFVDARNGTIKLIAPDNDLHAIMRFPDSQTPDWQDKLGSWVTEIVDNPDAVPHSDSAGSSDATSHELHAALLGEILTDSDHKETTSTATSPGFPSRKWQAVDAAHGRWWTGKSKAIWNRFEGWFKRGQTAPTPDTGPEPFLGYRQALTKLNYKYSSLYRGTFLANFVLAFVAVFLASFSLLLLSVTPIEVDPLRYPWSIYVLLIVLAIAKLCCVALIFWNTHKANHKHWNDKAVAFRYAAERLRAMLYLPLTGSLDPPAPAAPQYASRVIPQSAIDWLLGALVRAAPPESVFSEEKETVTLSMTSGTANETLEVQQITLDPRHALQTVQENWLSRQRDYHANNAQRMERMRKWSDAWAKLLNVGVGLIVICDILLLALKLSGLLPTPLKPLTPWLILLAAILPAAVASLNAIRFQSECARLAERSAALHTIIEGRSERRKKTQQSLLSRLRSKLSTLFPGIVSPPPRAKLERSGGKMDVLKKLSREFESAQASPDDDLGSWLPQVQRETEAIARVFVQEAAEWSVLYSKELPEP